jgi:hypothetical protein
MSFICRSVVGLFASLMLASFAFAQAPATPGPEHEKLKALEGDWDATIKMPEGESKGTMTWKMELGGLWLTSDFSGEFAGQKFGGKGLETYDAAKKKYVAIWADSMSTTPLVMEGEFDEAGKVQTMTGEGPGPDGANTKFKTTTEHKDKDTLLWTMHMVGADGAATPMFTITYKRRK